MNDKEQLENWKRKLFEMARSDKNKLIRYGIPLILFLLIISILFVSKPETTGYIILTQEKTYTDNLNLVINESGNYTWILDIFLILIGIFIYYNQI